MNKIKSLLILFFFILLGTILFSQVAMAYCGTCPGKITVCKTISGTAEAGQTFSVNLGFDQAVFTTPLVLNTDLFGNDGVKDAQCITYDNLPYAEYAYLEETLPETGWEIPLYNDQYDMLVDDLDDFFAFSSANNNSNGIIRVDALTPYRTLVVLNRVKAETPPADVPGCTDSEAINYNSKATVDDGSCEYELPTCPGKITVCKTISGTAEAGQTFSVNLGFDQAVFTTPLVLNTDLFGNDGVKDAQCITYDNLPYAEYAYEAETYPSESWQEPLYYDDFVSGISSADFCSYDGSRRILINEAMPEKTLVVLNRIKTVPETKFSISGLKFNDLNGNGTNDSEPGLASWQIILKKQDLQISAALTDSLGNYSFSNLDAGTYAVCEENRSDWNQTFPSGCHIAEIVNASLVGLNFGNKQQSGGGGGNGGGGNGGGGNGGGVPSPQLKVDKTAEKDTAMPGETVEYTITVENNSFGDAVNVRVKDILPVALEYADEDMTGEWNLGNLNVNEIVKITYEVFVPLNTLTGNYINTVEVQANNRALSTDTFSLAVSGIAGEEAFPVLIINKESNKKFVMPGSYLIFNLEVKNMGQAPAVNVVIKDTLPAGFITDTGLTTLTWEVPLIIVGESWKVSLPVYVKSDTPVGEYANIAEASAENHLNIVKDIETVQVVEMLPNTGADLSDQLPIILAGGFCLMGLIGLIYLSLSKKWAKLFFFAIVLASSVALAYPLWPSFEYSLAAIPEQETLAEKEIRKENVLVIPKIGVEIPIVEGKDESSLERGAWLLGSAPDEGENTALAAHRFRYRPPHKETFYLLDKLEKGDKAIVYWEGKEYLYVVISSSVVSPQAVEVLEKTSNPTLTLITCHPLFSDKNRLVVKGELLEI